MKIYLFCNTKEKQTPRRETMDDLRREKSFDIRPGKKSL